MEMIYPSAFANASAKLPPRQHNEKSDPLLTVEGDDHCCGYCGVPLHDGETAKKLNLGRNFNDRSALADRNARYRCLDCDALNVQAVLGGRRSSVVTREGWYPVSTDAALKYFLLNPPEPPFMFFCTDRGGSSMHHLVWRTPVSLSSKLFYIRHGNELFVINHDRLMAAVEANRRVAEALTAYNEDNADGKRTLYPRKSAFLNLSRMKNNYRHGSLDPTVYALGDRVTPEDVDLLAGLNPGEMWAMYVLAIANSDAQKPDFYKEK